MTQAISPTTTTCPAEIARIGRQALHREWWEDPSYQAIAAEAIRGKPCAYCGRPATLAHHDEDWMYLTKEVYYDPQNMTPACGTCHRKYRRGLVICPSCHKHYMRRTSEKCQYNSQDNGMALSRTISLLPTPNVCGNYNRKGASKTSGNGLATAIKILPTVTTRDYKDVGTMENVPVNALLGRELGKNHGLKLQPAFAEWMMGFPEGWTDLDVLEMPSSRNKSIRSSKRLQTLKKEE